MTFLLELGPSPEFVLMAVVLLVIAVVGILTAGILIARRQKMGRLKEELRQARIEKDEVSI